MHVPSQAGSHELTTPVWRPVGSAADEMGAFFLGGNPSLASTAVLSTSLSERHRLTGTGVGTVHLRLELIFRYMATHGVEW